MQRTYPRRSVWRPLWLMVALSCVMFMWPLAALAHAHPQQRTPAPQAVLQQAPQAVRIVFSEDLEPVFSTLKVTDDQGHVVSSGKASVGDEQPALLHVPLQALDTGTYTVRWHAVSVDGHTTEGQYTFSVQ